MKKKEKDKETNITFYRYLFLIIVFLSLVTLGLTYYLNLLPFQYFFALVGLLLILNMISLFLLKSKKIIIKLLGIIFSIILALGLIWIINYEFDTLQFLKKIGYESYNTENYDIYVLESSNYNNIDDLNNADIFYIKSGTEGTNLAINKIKESINVDFIEKYINDIKDELSNDNAIMIEKSMVSLIEELDTEFFDDMKSIHSLKVEYKIDIDNKDVDPIEDTFNIYISGIDSYNHVSSVARSDVNIIATINVKNGDILLTSIPRDYYVNIPMFNQMDKLTHVGLYGVDASIDTIENLLDIDIHYYLKVNFTTLIDLVDALDGIEINSNYSFTTQDGYYFKKGIQEIDGKEALSFSRERNAFTEGDRVRGENQQIIIEGIIDKALSTKILTDYGSILESLEDEFITNISDEEISELVKYQLTNNVDWNIESISLNGTDSNNKTYTYPHQNLYVMNPIEESIEEAKEKIKSILVE